MPLRVLEKGVLRRFGTVPATLGIAFVGGAILDLFGLPAGWLVGGVLAIAIAEMRGFATRIPSRLRDAGYFLLGSSLGTSLSAGALEHASTWPASLVILLLSVIVAQMVGQGWLVRFGGWSRSTAFFASIPGSVNFVLGAAERTNADLRLVAIAQMVRVLVLVVIFPTVVAIIGTDGAAATVTETISPVDAIELFGICALGAVVFNVMKMPTAILLGSLMASLMAYGFGLVSGAVPRPVLVAAMVVLATNIGGRFRGLDRRLLITQSRTALTAFSISMGFAMCLAVLAGLFSSASTESLIVAFAPGSLDTMFIMALSLHLDAAFVAVHQLVRFLGISFGLPLILLALGIRRKTEGIRKP